MLAASGGETVRCAVPAQSFCSTSAYLSFVLQTACLIRVPTEVVKQRQQTSAYGLGTSSFQAAKRVIAESGVRGLYTGFGTTVAREVSP